MTLRPTPQGTAGAVFTVALLLVGLAADDNVLVLIGAVLLAGMIVGGVAAVGNVLGTLVTPELPDEAFAGVSAPGAWQVRRRVPWPAYDVLLTPVGVDAAITRCPSLRPGRVPCAWTFRERGRHALTGVSVRSDWPFRLVGVERRVPVSAEVCVWPRPWDASGEIEGVTARSDPDEVHELRPHRPGDRLRDVHVRTSARRGTPMVVVRRSSPEAAAWVDVEPGVDREEAIGRAAGRVLRAAARGRPVGLRADGRTWPLRVGPTARRALLTALAELPGRGS